MSDCFLADFHDFRGYRVPENIGARGQDYGSELAWSQYFKGLEKNKFLGNSSVLDGLEGWSHHRDYEINVDKCRLLA